VRAWRIQRLGEPADVLELDEVDPPAAGPQQLLVRVLGCSIGFPDVLMCRGQYQERPSLPHTPGAEISAEVVSAPSDSAFAPGDRVLGVTASFAGGLGELATMDSGHALPAPPELSDAEASTLFSAYQTGWFGLHRRAGLRPRETLMVLAAAGGVGLAAVQLGVACGARVVAVVRGQEKAAAARAAGAALVIDRTREPVIGRVKEFTDGRGADVIYDPVGGSAYAEATKCVAFEGRIVIVGFAGGEIQAQRLNHPLLKNYSVVGLHFSLYLRNRPDLVRQAHDELCGYVRSGAVRPVVGWHYPFAQAPQALQTLAEGQAIGRGVVAGATVTTTECARRA
jgi:NADPH:quinone reductase